MRTDVVTALVDGADWPAAWAAAHSPAVRDGIIDAVAAVLRTLQKANALHPDLNVKNILISEAGGAPVAFVLDVDRVRHGTGPASDTGRRNAGRLHTSIAKWRSMRGLDISPSQMDRLMHGAGVPWTGQ